MIGKKASLDGSVIIGRNEDSRTAWPKHLAFHQRQAGAQTFKSHDNKFTIDLPEEAFAYSSTPEWTKKYGLFEEDGINEYHVAMSATESAYANERVLAIDPFDAEKGLLEEAMVTIVLPYVKTAQEGVKRLGEIVEKYGAAESNGILFADRDEAWYLEIGSGHHWVAQRIPDDSYTVVANQLSIQEIDFKDPANFLYSAGLREFVYEHQLWPKEAKFNWREIFGTRSESDLHYNTPRVWYGQKLLTPSVKQEPQSFDLPFIQKADRPLSVQDAQTVLASHYSDTEYDLTNPKNAGQASFRPIGVATTQESHLLQLKGEDMYHWLAMGVTAQSVYIPFFPQGTKVPYMWGNGKVDYSPNSAYWIFKLAGVLVDRNWGKYGKELANAQTEAKEKVLRLRYEYDQKLHADPSQATAIADEANAKMAKTVTDIYNKLISSLITQQTGDSPLSFQMDPNL
ncbi:cytosol non-specific dipeptidase [Lactobacillus delbrueckii subsp. indicus DSM 15996]|nr:cytosol non-specific dipeptidase [Lactobacillus delbrueckii subsp. indicus DSM 15996]